MKDKSEGTVADRRSFLKLASVGAVASGAAVLTGTKSADASVAEAGDDKLYRETGHIKTYYDLARF